MPTARELLEQADALMRRNRAGADRHRDSGARREIAPVRHRAAARAPASARRRARTHRRRRGDRVASIVEPPDDDGARREWLDIDRDGKTSPDRPPIRSSRPPRAPAAQQAPTRSRGDGTVAAQGPDEATATAHRGQFERQRWPRRTPRWRPGTVREGRAAAGRAPRWRRTSRSSRKGRPRKARAAGEAAIERDIAARGLQCRCRACRSARDSRRWRLVGIRAAPGGGAGGRGRATPVAAESASPRRRALGRRSPRTSGCRCCSGSTSSPTPAPRAARRAAAADRRSRQRRSGRDDQPARRPAAARLRRRGDRARDREVAEGKHLTLARARASVAPRQCGARRVPSAGCSTPASVETRGSGRSAPGLRPPAAKR